MRYPSEEKFEIIKLVEQSHLSAKQTLVKLGIPRSTFYRWYDLYQTGGIGQLTMAFANEWAAHGVNVNAIAPGYINTDNTEALRNDPERSTAILGRIPAGRWGLPEYFKGPAVFLASDASAYMHGHTMLVDGGWMGR